jgi:hypothetical protein
MGVFIHATIQEGLSLIFGSNLCAKGAKSAKEENSIFTAETQRRGEEL